LFSGITATSKICPFPVYSFTVLLNQKQYEGYKSTIPGHSQQPNNRAAKKPAHATGMAKSFHTIRIFTQTNYSHFK
jgi:hypothetical protein